MRKKIRVSTVICPGCKAEIYSRARHDFHTCGCPEQTFIDGGFDYTRYGGKSYGQIQHKTRYLPITRQKLYEDWNYKVDKLGVIKKDSK